MAYQNFAGTLKPSNSKVALLEASSVAFETELGTKEAVLNKVSLKDYLLELGAALVEAKEASESAKSTALDSSTLALAALELAEYAADDALVASRKAEAAEARVAAINDKLEDLKNNGLAEDGTVNAAYVSAIAMQSLENANALASIKPDFEVIKEVFGTEESGLLKDVAELKAGAGNKILDILVKKLSDREAISAVNLETGIATIDLSLINSQIKTLGENLNIVTKDIQNLKTTRGITGINVVSSGKIELATVTDGIATINLGEMVGKELDPIFTQEKANFVTKEDLSELSLSYTKLKTIKQLYDAINYTSDLLHDIQDSINNSTIGEEVTVESITALYNRLRNLEDKFGGHIESMSEQEYKDSFTKRPYTSDVLYLIEEEIEPFEIKKAKLIAAGFYKEAIEWIENLVNSGEIYSDINKKFLNELGGDDYNSLLPTIPYSNPAYRKELDMDHDGFNGPSDTAMLNPLYAYLYYNGPFPGTSELDISTMMDDEL